MLTLILAYIAVIIPALCFLAAMGYVVYELCEGDMMLVLVLCAVPVLLVSGIWGLRTISQHAKQQQLEN